MGGLRTKGINNASNDPKQIKTLGGLGGPTSGTHHAANADAVVLVGVDTEFGGDGQGCAVVQFATRSHMWVVDVRNPKP